MTGIKLHRSQRLGGGGKSASIQWNWIINNTGDGIHIKRFCLRVELRFNKISGNHRYRLYLED